MHLLPFFLLFYCADEIYLSQNNIHGFYLKRTMYILYIYIAFFPFKYERHFRDNLKTIIPDD